MANRKFTPAEAAQRKHDRKRLWIQAGFAALFNGYAAGFAKGKIFTGPS